jgi:hypothetical protein
MCRPMEEAAQLREDIRELLLLMGHVVETAGDRVLLEACAEVLRERLDQLAQIEDAAA